MTHEDVYQDMEAVEPLRTCEFGKAVGERELTEQLSADLLWDSSLALPVVLCFCLVSWFICCCIM